VATIVPFLRDGVFDPKDIQVMSMALDGVCKSLNLRDDREREIIAERIVDLARRGVLHDADRARQVGFGDTLSRRIVGLRTQPLAFEPRQRKASTFET
jgi:hypothetical protein